MKKNWKMELETILKNTKKAAAKASLQSSSLKNKLLIEIAGEIEKNSKWIIFQNQKDLKNAKSLNLSSAMIDRLTLNDARIKHIADGVRAVAKLKDPIGKTLAKWTRPNGLRIQKISVPLGVIFMIYESRPNVTVECAALCLKSSNAAILRGGREAMESNRAFVAIFKKVLKRHKISDCQINLVTTTDYEAVDFLLKQEGEIDLVIPRGGEKLIRRVVENSRVPVVKHYQGICHVYVDAKVDLKKAAKIVLNAKLQRPGVCNATETLLVHQKIAKAFLSILGEELKKAGCEVHGDKTTCQIIKWAKRAEQADYGHEFLDRILAIRVVKNISEAVSHIETFGSHHTDAIVTNEKRAADFFKSRVDSSSVMINASTRFSDGFEYGFGAEIGISTDKVHARGPMGLDGLTSYKYIVEGNGQIRA